MAASEAPAARTSPLAAIVLALLVEAPMHAYRMQQLIKQRAKDTVVNVESRNSIHQVLTRLLRDDLVEVHEQTPDRTVFAITESGRAVLMRWLRTELSTPRREFPNFPAALSLAVIVGPEGLRELLEQRVAYLSAELAEPGPDQIAEQYGLMRVFLIEDEFTRAMTSAELTWLRGVINDLRSGALTWTEEEVRAAGASDR